MTDLTDEGAAKVLRSFARSIEISRNGVAALEAALSEDEGFRAALVASVGLLRQTQGRIIVVGVGKSGHIGRKLAATLASTGSPAYFVHATEASHGDLGMVSNSDVIIALSWSGETSELSDTLHYAKRFSVPLIAITSGRNSALARHADASIILPVVTEACPHGLAPTTSTLLQLAVGDALAIAVLEMNGFSAADFGQLHPGGKLGARLRRASEIAHGGEAMPLIDHHGLMSDAIVEMTSKGFGCVGVTDKNGGLVGIVTDGDLRRHMDVDLLSKSVAEIMSRNPKTIAPAVLAGEALSAMQSAKISVLFIVDDKKPVAILHMQDLLRAGVV